MRAPCSAIALAKDAPPRPPPMTMTSYSTAFFPPSLSGVTSLWRAYSTKDRASTDLQPILTASTSASRAAQSSSDALHPDRAMQLDSAVEHVHYHVRRLHLDHRDFLARLALADRVDLPRRVHHHQPRRVDLDPRIRDPLLDIRLVGEQAAMRPARIGPLAHQFERALGDTDIAQTMMDTAWAEPRLRNRKAVAFAAEHIRGGYAAVRVQDFAMATASRMSHHRHRPHDLEAGSVDRNDQHAGALMRRGIRIGHHHRDRESRMERARGEPFVPVDYVVVAIPHGLGL